VLVLHGLTGSSASHYIVGQQCALAKQGWASVALNWRGCSGEPNLLARSYHSGASEDLAATVAHLRARYPLAPLYAVGYSLGGNVLLKYLGESGSASGLQGRSRGVGAVPPRPVRRPHRHWAFPRCIKRTSCARWWRTSKTNSASSPTTPSRKAWPALAKLGTLKSLSKMRTFWEFDDRVTAPLNGYLNVDDYYRRASSRYFLGAIETPTLIIQSDGRSVRVQAQHPRSQRAVALHRTGAARQGRPCGFRGRLARERQQVLP
jgi:uncharacterized protein